VKWVKKYWLTILIYMAIFINLLLVQPVLQRFYLHDELKTIERISWRVYWIIAAALFTGLLVYFLFTEIKRISTWGIGMVGFLFTLFTLVFFFRPIIETTILFANRLFPKGEYRTKFVVSGQAGGNTALQDIILADPVKKQSCWYDDKDKLVTAEQITHLRFGDTVYVTFRHGLFGIDYVGQ
jgi:hypothetical protein